MRNYSSMDSPKLSKGDSLEIKRISHPFKFRNSKNNDLNNLIVETINRMGGTGENADEEYMKSIKRLLRNPEEVIKIVIDEYNDMQADQYLDRWSLVQLLTDLKNEISLKALDRIISSKIPAEKSKNIHNFSTVAEEVMIRTTAVEAVTRIAADGNKQALDILLKNVKNGNFSIKRACVQGYLEFAGKEGLRRIKSSLPRSEQYIIDMKRKDVRDVYQATGGLHLVCRDQRDELPNISNKNNKIDKLK